MSKLWRPPDWDIADYFQETYDNPLQITRAFEAGADAMLKILKDRHGMKTVMTNGVIGLVGNPQYIIKAVIEGTLVFIPDNE